MSVSKASAQSNQSSLCVKLVTKDPNCLHVDSEDSDQTEVMPRSSRDAWPHCCFFFSCHGSIIRLIRCAWHA